jgi:hypothetical protein
MLCRFKTFELSDIAVVKGSLTRKNDKPIVPQNSMSNLMDLLLPSPIEARALSLFAIQSLPLRFPS